MKHFIIGQGQVVSDGSHHNPSSLSVGLGGQDTCHDRRICTVKVTDRLVEKEKI